MCYRIAYAGGEDTDRDISVCVLIGVGVPLWDYRHQILNQCADAIALRGTTGPIRR